MDTSYNMGSAQLGKIATIFVLIAGILLLIAGILGLVGGLSSYGPAHYGGGLIGSVITLVAGAVALDERLEAGQWLGGGLIALAIIGVQLAPMLRIPRGRLGV